MIRGWLVRLLTFGAFGIAVALVAKTQAASADGSADANAFGTGAGALELPSDTWSRWRAAGVRCNY